MEMQDGAYTEPPCGIQKYFSGQTDSCGVFPVQPSGAGVFYQRNYGSLNIALKGILIREIM